MSEAIITDTICIRCREAKCNGSCICHAEPGNPVLVEIRLERGECPKNYFNEPHKLPRRKTFTDLLDADELAIVNEIDKAPEGLGDTLKSLFAKIGADKAAKLFEKITGHSCNCEQRRKWLNRWWPYKPST